jgi:hypothetical protein
MIGAYGVAVLLLLFLAAQVQRERREYLGGLHKSCPAGWTLTDGLCWRHP